MIAYIADELKLVGCHPAHPASFWWQSILSSRTWPLIQDTGRAGCENLMHEHGACTADRCPKGHHPGPQSQGRQAAGQLLGQSGPAPGDSCVRRRGAAAIHCQRGRLAHSSPEGACWISAACLASHATARHARRSCVLDWAGLCQREVCASEQLFCWRQRRCPRLAALFRRRRCC
jgi:hypothetical protein